MGNKICEICKMEFTDDFGGQKFCTSVCKSESEQRIEHLKQIKKYHKGINFTNKNISFKKNEIENLNERKRYYNRKINEHSNRIELVS